MDGGPGVPHTLVTIAVIIVAGACGIAAGTPLAVLGAIGRAGRMAGEFFHIHSIATDPKGNIITGESQGYRMQRFLYKGLSSRSTQ